MAEPVDLERLSWLLERAGGEPSWLIEWEVCDCGGDYPCSHGKFVYRLLAVGRTKPVAEDIVISNDDAELLVAAVNALPGSWVVEG